MKKKLYELTDEHRAQLKGTYQVTYQWDETAMGRVAD